MSCRPCTHRRLSITLLLVLGIVACRAPATPPSQRKGSSAERSPEAKGLSALAGLRALIAALPKAPAPPLDQAGVTKLVSLSLHCVDREYPNKPGHVWAGDVDARPPRRKHPAFFGCFDWHSAVHGHWAMVRVLARFPAHPLVPKLRAALDKHLTAKNLAVEAATFAAQHDRLFERPYGWAWYLRLVHEVRALAGQQGPHQAAARAWARALAPLETLLVKRTLDYLARLSRPVRAGTHASTAFALAHVLDYARDRPAPGLRTAVVAAAKRFYRADRACPTAYEPSGEDFISPCLAEADLMRRVLSPADFAAWLKVFLPPLTSAAFGPLRSPPPILDLKDPRIGHLIGLSLQRAWCLRGIAGALPGRGLVALQADLLRRLADAHLVSASAQIFASGYGGAHWLASFALFALTHAGQGR